MHNFYIGCNVLPSEDTGATRLECNYTQGATLLTQQQVSDIYSPPLSAEDGALFAGVIFMTSMVAWGIRLALKQYNLGV